MASNTQSFRRNFITPLIVFIITLAVYPHSVAASESQSPEPSSPASISLADSSIASRDYAGLQNRFRRLPLNRDNNSYALTDKTRYLTGLQEFSQKVQNGEAETLRGVYVKGLFTFPVVQQESHGAGFVSSIDGTLTEFSLADQFGNVGLLAHNYLSGRLFPQLKTEQLVILIFGDGRMEYYQVREIHEYQALSPYSPYSEFRDLGTNQWLDASGLFSTVYRGNRHVTFQTCIDKDGLTSWGRLFVIAEPVEDGSDEMAAE